MSNDTVKKVLSPKNMYSLNGGPMDGAKVALSTSEMLPMTFGSVSGQYVHRNHSIGLYWVPRGQV